MLCWARSHMSLRTSRGSIKWRATWLKFLHDSDLSGPAPLEMVRGDMHQGLLYPAGRALCRLLQPQPRAHRCDTLGVEHKTWINIDAKDVIAVRSPLFHDLNHNSSTSAKANHRRPKQSIIVKTFHARNIHEYRYIFNPSLWLWLSHRVMVWRDKAEIFLKNDF